MENKKLTAANGRPVADNQNIQTVGPRGQVLLQDPWVFGETGPFRPRSYSRKTYACQRLRSIRYFHRHT